jgi:hypothetical protein
LPIRINYTTYILKPRPPATKQTYYVLPIKYKGKDYAFDGLLMPLQGTAGFLLPLLP